MSACYNEDMTECLIDGCEKPMANRKWCWMHYYRWRRHGDPLEVGRPQLPRQAECGDFASMFWTRATVGSPDECWRWKMTLMPNGYGRINDSRNGTRPYAHRVAYELTHGPIPSGFEIHHRCKTRACVNPHHLDAMSASDHRHLNLGFTHCPRGHEYTATNTYVNPKGVNICRICLRLSRRRADERKRNP